MKFKLYLIIALAFSVGINACTSDQIPAPIRNLDYGDRQYSLDRGAFIDLGITNIGTSVSHYQYEFVTTDGIVAKDNLNNYKNLIGNIGVRVKLLSPGSGGFTTGTFNYIDGSSDALLSPAQLQAKYENKFYFNSGMVATSEIENDALDDNMQVKVKSGIVVVSGTSPNYTINYDLFLEDNKTLKGGFTFEFPRLTL